MSELILHPRQRRLTYMALFPAMLVTGVMFGLSQPLLAIKQEMWGLSGTFIGISTAMPSLAIIICAPQLPKLAQRVGTLPLLFFSALLSAACFLAYLWIDDPYAWLPLRFVHGAAHTGLMTVAEFWINAITPDNRRGRMMGVLGAVLSAGFAIGPIVLQFTGFEGSAPFLAGAALMLVAAVPIGLAMMAKLPSLNLPSEERPERILTLIKLAPAAILAALLFGAYETAMFNLLPVYGVRSGLTATEGAAMLTAMGVGNLLLLIPIGILADRINRHMVLLLCAATAAFSGVLLPLSIHDAWLYLPLLAGGMGIVSGLYTVGLALLGARFTGVALVNANAAFIMLYAIGTLVAPPIAGAAMDITGPNGLPYLLAGIMAAYVLLILTRMRRPQTT
ncbi:MAG: MFS transporter [Alphaproteobacteria bacterium]